MFGHAAVGVDFSSGGEAVLRSLPNLRVLGTTRLSLVHAVSALDFTDTRSPEYPARMEPWKTALEKEGFVVSVDIIPDEPSYGLQRIARERAASLMVVGSRSDSRSRDFFVGSVAWDVVRGSNLPVLIQRVEPIETEGGVFEVAPVPPFEHIVFPTDGSETAERAFQYVQAAAVEGGIGSFLLMSVRSELDETRSGVSTEAEELRRLNELAARLREVGAAHVDVATPSGAPFVEIVRAAGSRRGTLTVMGTHGRGLIGDAFLGSVSRDVVRQSSGSVLLIPRKHKGD